MYASSGNKPWEATEEDMTLPGAEHHTTPIGVTHGQVEGAINALKGKRKSHSTEEIALINLIKSYRATHPSCQLIKQLVEDANGVQRQIFALDSRCINCREADALLIDALGKEQ
jgi:hypothetical protein